ncbi:MAG: class I SAM-dependent methyltransferase [bacterium]
MMYKRVVLITFFMSSCAFVHGAQLSDSEKEENRLLNLVQRAKKQGPTAYKADKYPAGYHSLTINGKYIKGKRDPKTRFSHVPYDFTGKTVLDIGSNEGGMLLYVADKIKYGVGIDYNKDMINLANRLKSHYACNSVDFYMFDLEKEPLLGINDFLKSDTVDICFLLSMCRWLKNWKKVVDYACDVSTTLLFESNDGADVQKREFEYLKLKYNNIKLLSAGSDDDPRTPGRKLYLCSDKK